MYQHDDSGPRTIADLAGGRWPSRRDADRVQVLGHRGSPDPGCPENSVAAVAQALRQGADGVEVDVRLTADGVLLCVHDEFLFSDDGARLDVATSGSEDLLGVAGRTAPGTLAQVLAAAQHPVGSRVVVEAKPVSDRAVAERTAVALADLLATAAGSAEVTVSSFDPDLLAAIRRACAALPVRTALLGGTSVDATSVVKRAHADGHDEVHLPLVAVRRTPLTVALAQWLGLSVALWTVNRGRDLRWVAALGVDAVITDDVTSARSKLDRAMAEELLVPVEVDAA